MLTECVDARAFYESETGQMARSLLRQHIAKICPPFAGETKGTLGCASLLLDAPDILSCRIDKEKFSAMVDSRGKPYPEATFDVVVALHAATSIDNYEQMLRESWRILKGEGRLILIVPKHNGFWTRNPKSPFANEVSYTPRQIVALMNKHFFYVRHIEGALYATPSCCVQSRTMAQKIEQIAPWIMLKRGGGVLIVEAQKRVHGAIGCRAKGAKRSADPLFPLPLPI